MKRKILCALISLLTSITLPLALAQADRNTQETQTWIGHSTDQGTSCELTLAPSLSRKQAKYAYLKVNQKLVALGNPDTDVFEMIKEVPQTVPQVNQDIRLYNNIPTTLVDRNLEKNIFLFIGEGQQPKLISGVIFSPEMIRFQCGHFTAATSIL